MTNAIFACVVFCALPATMGCQAPSPSWDGTWVPNPLKSTAQGEIMTISISPDGVYHYDDGHVTTTYRCDGKYRPMAKNRTQNCVRTSATTLDKTRLENGVETNKYHLELSDGGKVLTSTATRIGPSGPVNMGQLVARCISSCNGFAGKWQYTNLLQHLSGMTLKMDAEYLHIGYPGAGDRVDAPLTGADAAMHGANASSGFTRAVRMTGQRALAIETKLNGKPFTQESLKLSDDGRIITDSYFNPARPTDKGTLVYEKR